MLRHDHVVKRGEVAHERQPLAAVARTMQQEHGLTGAGAPKRNGAAAHGDFCRRRIVHSLGSLHQWNCVACHRFCCILHLHRRGMKGILRSNSITGTARNDRPNRRPRPQILAIRRSPRSRSSTCASTGSSARRIRSSPYRCPTAGSSWASGAGAEPGGAHRPVDAGDGVAERAAARAGHGLRQPAHPRGRRAGVAARPATRSMPASMCRARRSASWSSIAATRRASPRATSQAMRDARRKHRHRRRPPVRRIPQA